jgi:hypothetical protein
LIYALEHDKPSDPVGYATRSTAAFKTLWSLALTKNLGVGIIGCGNISTAYLSSPMFPGYKRSSRLPMNMDTARAGRQVDVRADTVDDLLAATDVDLVVTSILPRTSRCPVPFCKRASTYIPKKPFV